MPGQETEEYLGPIAMMRDAYESAHMWEEQTHTWPIYAIYTIYALDSLKDGPLPPSEINLDLHILHPIWYYIMLTNGANPMQNNNYPKSMVQLNYNNVSL